MTTIAANKYVMASDTRMTEEGGPYTNVDKIYRVGNSILGFCGDAMMARYFVEWFRSPKRNPAMLHKAIDELEYRSAIAVMELNPGGIFLWDGWGVPIKIRDPFYAIGSGSPAALAELKRNRKRTAPIDAIRAAMSVDENTGGDVIFEELLKKGI